MNKHIVLVYPKAGDQKIISAVPHSILALEKPLADAGYHVTLVDEKLEKYDIEKIFSHADCIGFSVMTGPQIEYALQLNKKAKSIHPDIPVIWGGWHATLLPEQTLSHPLIDYVCLGEGEKRIVELLESIFENKDISSISGIGYKKSGAIHINSYEPGLQNTDTFIDYTRYDLSDYTTQGTVDLISSFGCPYSCAFCSQNSVFGRRWKGQSPAELFQTVSYISKTYNVKEFEFVDTNFFVSKKRVLEFAELLKHHELNVKWGGSIRADQLMLYTESEFEYICRSGFSTAAIGFESASDEILCYIQKKEPVSVYYDAVKRCKKYTIDLFGTFITGLPEETSEDYEKTRSFIEWVKQDYAHARIVLLYYTPYPGTPLYEDALKHHFMPPETLDGWALFSHNNINIPWFSTEKKALIDADIMRIHADNISERIDPSTPVFIYGASLSGKIALSMIETSSVQAFVETNPSQNMFENIPVISYNDLVTQNAAQIVIASYGYQDEIEKMILTLLPDAHIIKLYPETIFYI